MERILILFAVALVSQAVNSEPLCGSKPNVHDLIIGGSEFNYKNALKAIKYLGNVIPDFIDENHNSLVKKIISGEHTDEASLNMRSPLNAPELYAGYPNQLSIIRGVLLKQRALMYKYRYVSTNKEEDKIEYKKALKEFCELENDSSYVD